MARRITLLVLMLVFAAPAYLAAQEPVLAPGSRIRVYAPSINAKRFVGTVVSLNADALTLDAEMWLDGVWKPRLDVPFASMKWLGLSRGRHSNAGKGALIGGLVGTALILAAVYSCDGYCGGPGDEGRVLAGMTIGGGLGAGVGALIGALSHREDWQAVPIERLRSGPSPVSVDGVAVSLTLRL